MLLMVNFNQFHEHGIEIKTIDEIDSFVVGKKLSELNLKHGQEVEISYRIDAFNSKSKWKVIDTTHETFRNGLTMEIKILY